MKRTTIVLVALLLVTVTLLAACGGGSTTTTSSAPATTASTVAMETTTTPAAETTTSAETATTVAPNPDALAKVVAAAKAEGSVDYMCAGHVYDAAKFEEGIKKTFGVDIKVNVIPGDQRQAIANLDMQAKSGAAPSYDVVNVATPNILSDLVPNKLVASIDWPSLLSNQPMDPTMLLPDPLNLPGTWSYVTTLAYNADKTSADKIPQTYSDFANPKYQGQLGWVQYSQVVSELLYYADMTNSNGLAWLKKIVDNKPVLGGWGDLADKLNLGEVTASIIASHEYDRVSKQNPQIKWALPKDYIIVEENSDVVLNGGKHPNAATLLVLWLCTADGRAYNGTTGFGSYKDQGTVANAMVTEAQKDSVPVYYPERDADYIKWASSQDAVTFSTQVDGVIRGSSK